MKKGEKRRIDGDRDMCIQQSSHLELSTDMCKDA